MFELIPLLNYDLWYGMPELDPIYYWEDEEDRAGAHAVTNTKARVSTSRGKRYEKTRPRSGRWSGNNILLYRVHIDRESTNGDRDYACAAYRRGIKTPNVRG